MRQRDDHSDVDGQAAGDVDHGDGVQGDGGTGGHGEVPDQAVGGVIADPDLSLDDLGMQVAGDQKRVQGDEGFAFALEHVEDPGLERLDQGRRAFPLDLARAVGELDLDLEGVGPGGRHDDVVGADQVLDPLVLDLGVDLVAVDFGVAVDLVEDEDDRLLGLAELGQGFDLGALHVAGDDEEEQIAMAGDVAGEGLADLAADLVDSGRVDDDEPGPLQAGPAGRVVLPALGGALDGRAVRRADREDILAHERVQDRRLAPADHAEGGDLDRRLLELLAEVAQLRQARSASAASSSGVSFRLARVASRLALRARRDSSSSAMWVSSWSSNSLSSWSAMRWAFH